MIRDSLKHLFSRLGYPKIILLLAIYAITLILVGESVLSPYKEFLVSLGTLGSFLAGFFYAYEITALPATAVLLLVAKSENIFFAAIVGGLGALASDIIIFYFVRTEMLGEISKMAKTKLGQFIEREEGLIFGRFKKYVLYCLGAVFVASPLPTEIGVSIFATMKSLTPRRFIALAGILHTIGIFTILWIGTMI